MSGRIVLLSFFLLSFSAVLAFPSGTTERERPVSAPTLPGVPDSSSCGIGQKTWDYVILGSSIGTWWWPAYARFLESDLGVRIVPHQHSVSSQTVENLLLKIRTDETIREELRQAEVITIGIGYADVQSAINRYCPGQGLPVPEGQALKADPAGMERALEAQRERYNELLAEIWRLTCDTHPVIRLMDFYCPYAGDYRKAGTWDRVRPWWMRFTELYYETARRHGMPIAKVFAAFHGSDGSGDPAEKGLIANDRLHPSDAGMELIAREFRTLGYN